MVRPTDGERPTPRRQRAWNDLGGLDGETGLAPPGHTDDGEPRIPAVGGLSIGIQRRKMLAGSLTVAGRREGRLHVDTGLLPDAFAWTSRVVGEVKPDQLALPTPCEDWTVRMLVNHMVGALQAFAEGVPNGRVSPQVDPSDDDLSGEDPAGAYHASWPGVLDAWAAADADGATEFPWGPMPNTIAVQLLVLESTVHGWDLATATGQDVAIPEQLTAATAELATMLFADPAMRGHDFKPPIEVSDDAGPTASLVAFLGRHS